MQKFKNLFRFFKAFKLKSSRANELNKGFTLLELLIVIAILATLATIVVIVLNPAETLAKSRDTQRMSDLSTMKSAIALYMTTISSPQLDGTGGTKNDKCLGGGGTKTVFLSLPDTAGGGTTITSGYPTGFTAARQVSVAADNSKVDGTGWISVDLTDIAGGSPLSNLPVDPVNTAASAALADSDLIYRYACQKSPLGFELNAVLESTEYKTTQLKMTKDGGDSTSFYEIGTALNVLP